MSIRRSTGYSAFEFVYGRDCLLSIDFSPMSCSVVNWESEVRSREDLLVVRLRQLTEHALEESREDPPDQKAVELK